MNENSLPVTRNTQTNRISSMYVHAASANASDNPIIFVCVVMIFARSAKLARALDSSIAALPADHNRVPRVFRETP